jgi:hypothetical protein
MTERPKKKRTGAHSEKRERVKRKTIRFLDDEYATIQAKAAGASLSFGAYLRACALGDAGPRAQRTPSLDRELAAQGIAELNKAGSNLNQIARAVNMGNWPGSQHVTEACDAVKGAALQILRAYGYKTHDRQG